MDIGVITNPNARKNKLHPERAGDLARLVGNAGMVVQTKQLADIKPAIRTFLTAGCKYIVADGGDGALHWVMRSALEVVQEPAFRHYALPPIMPTRGGTIDFVASNVGLVGNAESLLAALRDSIAREAPIATAQVETMCIDATVAAADGTTAPLRTYGFAVAAGGIGQRFFDKYYQDPDPNPRTIMRVVGHALASMPVAFSALRHVPRLAPYASYANELFSPTRAQISIDGVTLPGNEFTGIHIASMSINLGGVFRFFGKADAPGVMNALVGAPSALGIARNLPRMAMGKDMTGRDIIDRPCRELIVTATDGTLLSPVIDGEYYRNLTRLEFRLGPTIAVPRVLTAQSHAQAAA